MHSPGLFVDSHEHPAPDDLVAFTVVCEPAAGGSIDDVRKRLAEARITDVLPSEHTRNAVIAQLRARGFTVFPSPAPVIFARGTVTRFTATFGGELVRLRRRARTRNARGTTSAIIVRPGTSGPTPGAVTGVLRVLLVPPPTFTAPAIPPGSAPLCLRLPGDIALLTGAAATHRRMTPAGELATGRGIGVAVVDTGFALHPYFEGHGYDIQRMSGDDVDHPEIDEDFHGTYVLANMLACAPDARAIGVKAGRTDWAIAKAVSAPGVRVVSLSWTYELDGAEPLPEELLSLEMVILWAVETMGIVVVVAAGNRSEECFPATLPYVIAVGGVQVDDNDGLSVWPGTSSFLNSTNKGRSVPDVCGVASPIMLPVPEAPDGTPFGWECLDGATSCATPQVSGVAALLIQKDPTMSPAAVRHTLVNGATDITSGSSWNGDVAVAGIDRATGGGAVSGLRSWLSV